MNRKPRLLDLFSGAGGCARGYMDAGFYVVGCDIVAQPRYCGDEFYQDDALAVLDLLLAGGIWHGYRLSDFAVIHASPVCKAYTQLNLSPKEKHEKLIAPVIERLRQSGKIFVVENVAGARRELPGALWLCGSMFAMKIWRHRLFESNILLFAPGPCQHKGSPISVHGHHGWDHSEWRITAKGERRYRRCSPEESKAAMGIDWMQRDELSESVPPAYTRYIGEQLMPVVLANREVAS